MELFIVALYVSIGLGPVGESRYDFSASRRDSCVEVGLEFSTAVHTELLRTLWVFVPTCTGVDLVVGEKHIGGLFTVHRDAISRSRPELYRVQEGRAAVHVRQGGAYQVDSHLLQLAVLPA